MQTQKGSTSVDEFKLRNFIWVLCCRAVKEYLFFGPTITECDCAAYKRRVFNSRQANGNEESKWFFSFMVKVWTEAYREWAQQALGIPPAVASYANMLSTTIHFAICIQANCFTFWSWPYKRPFIFLHCYLLFKKNNLSSILKHLLF